MSAEIRGLYITLLCVDWLEDGFMESEMLALSGYNYLDKERKPRTDNSDGTAIALLSRCFIAHPSKEGFLTNPRLQKEREKQAKRRAEKTNAGKKGAKARWNKDLAKMATAWQPHSNRNATALANDGFSSSSSSSNNIYIPPSNVPPASEPAAPKKKKREPIAVQNKTLHPPYVWLTERELRALTEKYGGAFAAACIKKLNAWIETDPTPKRIRNGRNAAACFRSWVIDAIQAREHSNSKHTQQKLSAPTVVKTIIMEE